MMEYRVPTIPLAPRLIFRRDYADENASGKKHDRETNERVRERERESEREKEKKGNMEGITI